MAMIVISNYKGNTLHQLNSLKFPHKKSRLALFRFFLISPLQPPSQPDAKREDKKRVWLYRNYLLVINALCRIQVTSRWSLFLISPARCHPPIPKPSREDRKKLHRAAAPCWFMSSFYIR